MTSRRSQHSCRHQQQLQQQQPSLVSSRKASVESGLADIDFLSDGESAAVVAAAADHVMSDITAAAAGAAPVTSCSSSSTTASSSLRSTPDLDLPLGHVFPSILDSLQWITERAHNDVDGAAADHRPVPLKLKQAKHVQVLCTGSMHLVGGLLGILDPDLNSHSTQN